MKYFQRTTKTVVAYSHRQPNQSFNPDATSCSCNQHQASRFLVSRHRAASVAPVNSLVRRDLSFLLACARTFVGFVSHFKTAGRAGRLHPISSLSSFSSTPRHSGHAPRQAFVFSPRQRELPCGFRSNSSSGRATPGEKPVARTCSHA